MTDANRRLPRALHALAFRNFRLIWLGQFARGIAQWTQLTAIPVLVLHLGGSPFDLGVVAALQFGPVFVIAPLAGVVADAVDKRRSLATVQLVLMAQGVAIVALTGLGMTTIPSLFVLSAIFGIANATEMPLRQSFVAELVPSATLPNAITLQQLAFNLSRFVAPLLAGFAIVLAGFPLTFFIAALASATSVILLRAMGTTARSAPLDRPVGFLDALIVGAKFIASTPAVRNTLFVLFGTTGFGLGVQTVLPVYALVDLRLDSWGYGALLAAFAAGAALGAGSMTVINTQAARRVMTIGLAITAIALTGLAIGTSPLLAFALVAVIGFSCMSVFGSANMTVQSNVHHGVRGRVMGFYIAIYSAGVALGGIFVGAVASAFDARSALALDAAGVAILSGWAALFIARPRARHDRVETDPITTGAI